ncbi:MAG: hypothetical protein PHH82_04280 [Candidatus ainarchaeum sp.]|nr:hypothetical protein [Candidatus ainarchaeum sp.]
MAVESRELVRIKNQKGRKITPDDVMALAILVEEAVRTKGPDFVAAPIVQKLVLRKEGKITPEAIMALIRYIFPREQLRTGESPLALAKNYVEQNRTFKTDRLYAQAKLFMAENPGISYQQTAKKIGIDLASLRRRLRGEGVKKLSSAERGRRVLKGRGDDSAKVSYGTYISKHTFNMLKLIIETNHNDLLKAEREWGEIIKNEKTARLLFRVVFPAYLMESIGLEGCIKRYDAWLDTNPRWTKREKERHLAGKTKQKKDPVSEDVKKERANESSGSYPRGDRVMVFFNRFLESKIKEDNDVGNKKLFLGIAMDILKGENGIGLSERHNLDQLTIIGVRRKIMNYFFEYQNNPGGIANRKKLLTLLNATNFYDTFHDGWVSPEYRDHVTRTNRIVDGIVHSLREPVWASMHKEMKKDYVPEVRKEHKFELKRV